MGTRATGTVTSKAWEQTPYAEIEARHNSPATGEDRYDGDGDVEGDASWRGLMISGPDGSGTFRSVQRMDCVLAGRRGCAMPSRSSGAGRGRPRNQRTSSVCNSGWRRG